jgi:hypothetical protein
LKKPVKTWLRLTSVTHKWLDATTSRQLRTMMNPKLERTLLSLLFLKEKPVKFQLGFTFSKMQSFLIISITPFVSCHDFSLTVSLYNFQCF